MKLITLIKKIVEKNPNEICITKNGKSLTYKEFWKLCLMFSSYINLHSTKNKIVCIYEKDNFYDYIAIIGTLISGGTYVPLNKSMPDKKIKVILKKINPEFFFNGKNSFKDVKKINEKIFQQNIKPKQSKKKLKLAYILFTSGTTGEPKGVKISRNALDHYAIWLKNNIKIKKKFKVSQIPSIGFDLSVSDIFSSLIVGGELIIPNNDEMMFIGNYIKNQKIDHLVCTPSTIDYIESSGQLLKKNLSSLKSIFFCGEVLYEYQLSRLFSINNSLNIINAYGPTEATCSMSYVNLSFKNYRRYCNKTVSIGSPNRMMKMELISNSSDNQNFGEIFISGPQLAEGYFQNQKETKKKFILIKNRKYYKTGDLAKKFKGNLYFVGRADNQIKLKGFRIELNEIDFYLIKFGFNKSYSIFLNSKIITFVQGKQQISKKLKDYLKKNLEYYKIPQKIIKVKKFLLNKNGKIDTDYLKKKIRNEE